MSATNSNGSQRAAQTRSFPSLEEAKRRYRHGTHARYVLARCRCARCREANRKYELERMRLRRPPYHLRYVPATKQWVVRNGLTGEIVFRCKTKSYAQRRADKLNQEHSSSTELIDVHDVVEHVRMLQQSGIGIKTIARASTVASSVISRMLDGDIRRTRRATAAKILRLGPEIVKDGARMRDSETLVLIDRLRAAGYRLADIARQLGSATPALQIGKSGWIRIEKARAVHALFVRLAKKDPKLGAPPPFRIGEVESSLARFRGRNAATLMGSKRIVRPHRTAARFADGCRCKGCVRANHLAAKAIENREGLRFLVRPVPMQQRWNVVDTASGAVVLRTSVHDDANALRDSLNAQDPRAAQKMLIDAAPAQAKIHELMIAGTGITAIASAIGVSSAQIASIRSGATRRTARRTADLLLALQPGTLPSGGRIDAATTWSMIDRLIAVGFRGPWIAALLGLRSTSLSYRGKTISLSRARDILSLYATLRERIPAIAELESVQKVAA